MSNSVVDVAYLEPNSKQKGDASNSVVDVATLEPHGKQNGDASNSVVDVAPLEPHGKQNRATYIWRQIQGPQLQSYFFPSYQTHS